MAKPVFVAIIASVLFAARPFGAMIPVIPLLPRDTNPVQSTSQLNPLDYAPDFSKDPFPPYPEVHQADGSNFTAQNWRGTRLFGWKGCGKNERKIIIEAWNDFHTLAQQKELYKNIDWSSQAAREIWGHSKEKKRMIPDDTKEQIKQIYQSTQQMYDSRWWPPYDLWNPPGFGWRNLWVQVQCSPDGDDSDFCGDKGNQPPKCPPGNPPSDGKEPDLEAYSEPYGKYSKTTFCNLFFNDLNSLSEVMLNVKSGREDRNDLWSYQNRARVMFHEMTHQSYFMNAPAKSPIIDDVEMDLKPRKKTENRDQVPFYGPENVKILANYAPVGKGGFFTQRNADSFAWFAVAKYAENQVGRYPNNPVIRERPLRAPRRGDGEPFDFVADDLDGNNTDSNNEQFTEDTSHRTPGCSDVLQPPAEAIGVASANTGKPSCENEDVLSSVPYNVFSGENTGVYGEFCYQFDHKQKVEWTVDAHGNQKWPTPNKVKRTPPPNPTAYDSFSFDLAWEPNPATQGCAQTVDSCMQAFEVLTESPCGHQGDKKNLMTAAGKFDIPKCGTYSYSIIEPRLPRPVMPSPPAPSLGSQWCYPAFNGHDDIQGSEQSNAAEAACANANGHMIKHGDLSTNIHFEPTNFLGTNAYIYDVYWTPGCESAVIQIDAGRPLADKPETCASLLQSDYSNCNNGGVGGKITVGCLTYQFSIGNKP